MNVSQQRAWAAHRGSYVIDVARDVRSTSVAEQSRLDLTAVYGREAPLIVEIGSGTGHALAAAAATRPDANHLAFEVFEPAVASTVGRLAAHGLTNVRVVLADGVEGLTHLLAPRAATEVRIWFPDPWHKARHAKRRLVSAEFASLVASRLQPGGVLRLATDWADYAEHARAILDHHEGFTSLNPVARFDERPLTKYEARGVAAGRTIVDLAYRVAS